MRRLTACIIAVLLASASVEYTSAKTSPPPKPKTVEVKSDSLTDLLEAYILQKGIEIVKGNIEAAKNESGDIDKAIRATLGISIADIKRYGLLGGPNSEMRKLFKALGLAEEVS
ncbi:MAG: hypothetical protein KF751_10625 [Nitrospira sp.]|nr:hypothetical protein [Nitrospira sp.]